MCGGDFFEQVFRQMEELGDPALQSSKPGRRCSQSKGPEAGICLAYLEMIKEAIVAGAE